VRFWDLANVGEGNLYYAATVKSMTTSLAAFVYGSFDPGLFVSVDKPAPGLWPQAIAARAFGFSGLALQIPQAICGTLSVALLSTIVARVHGVLAGALAGLALAIAPVAVAVDRNNTMDAELVLILLLAVACSIAAVERGARWLVVAGVLVGVGFNIKMSQAYVVAPALALGYLVASTAPLLRRVLHLAAFAIATVAVSLLWIAFVDLTPPSERPYVGSSANNTALELALGHNGLARLPQALLWWRTQPNPPIGPNRPVPLQPVGPSQEVGDNGPLRLFNEQLAGQVSWYLPIALMGAAALFAREWGSPRSRAALVIWIAWLIPTAILFSWSGIFHRYYLVMLAPPLAALVGAGAVALVTLARTSLAWRAAFTIAAIATAWIDLLIVSRAAPFASWLAPLAVVGVFALIVWLVVLRWRKDPAATVRAAMLSIAALAFFAGPLAWSSTTLGAANPALPFAGPELLRGPRPPGAAAPAPRNALLSFLEREHRDEVFIVATAGTMSAAPLILASGHAVMALGGFSGSDPILTPPALESRIRAGDVRFVLIEERMRPDLLAWVRGRCTEVPRERTGLIAGPPASDGRPPALMDCATVRRAELFGHPAGTL